jgi:hypothetical protein
MTARPFAGGIALARERLDWSEEDDMANDPMRERNPMRDDDEDIDRTTEEDIVAGSDEEDFEDIDEMEDDEDLEA